MTHRALIVAAVSTIAQAADDKASIPRQLEDCRAACRAHGWDIASEITIPGHSRNYDDLAELVADCPEYGQIIKAVASNTITLVVAWAYDRLYRTDALRAQVSAYCRRHRVQVYALDQPSEPSADGSTSFGTRAMETLKGLISEDENEKRRLRSKAGKEYKVLQGYSMHNNHVPYGYRKIVGDNILEVVPAAANLVRWIFERRAYDRWSTSRIKKDLNNRGIPSPNNGQFGWIDKTVSTILSNAFYKGTIKYGAVTCETGRHEAIVSPELWQAAQLATPTGEQCLGREPKLLTGLCRCGYCGKSMIYQWNKRNNSYGLGCSRYYHTAGRFCQCNYQQAKPIEQLVLDLVVKALLDPEAFLTYRTTKQAERKHDDRELLVRDKQAANAELERWKLAFGAGIIDLDELSSHNRQIKARLTDLNRQLQQYEAEDRRNIDMQTKVAKLADVAGQLYGLGVIAQRDAVKSLIDHVVLQRGQEPLIVWL